MCHSSEFVRYFMRLYHARWVIMLWDITGANRETGEDAAIQIEADDRESAIRRASRAGVLVSAAEPSKSAPMEFEPLAFEPAESDPVNSEPYAFANEPVAASSFPTLAFTAPVHEAPPAFLPYASMGSGRPVGLPASGMGIASLVLGCVSLLVIVVPCLNLLSIPMALLGLVFGIISWVTAANNKQSGVGFPIAGTSVSAFSLLALVSVVVYFAVAFSGALKASTYTPVTASTNSRGPVFNNLQQQMLAAQQQALLQRTTVAQRQAAAQKRAMLQQLQQQQYRPPQPYTPGQFPRPYQPPLPPTRSPGQHF
jgi:hypothetical protein